MDQSIEMLLKAKRKYDNIKLRMGNFLDEPFTLNEFDAIVSTYAFHHLNLMEKENSINLTNGAIFSHPLMWEMDSPYYFRFDT